MMQRGRLDTPSLMHVARAAFRSQARLHMVFVLDRQLLRVLCISAAGMCRVIHKQCRPVATGLKASNLSGVLQKAAVLAATADEDGATARSMPPMRSVRSMLEELDVQVSLTSFPDCCHDSW